MKIKMRCETPLGALVFAEEDGWLTDLFREGQGVLADVAVGETPLLLRTAGQLQEYFAGLRTRFDLPLAPRGTAFQQTVWQALCAVPYGETRTYGQVAASISNPRACRAVGMANNKNPISIVIPCHRVIGAGGGLVGYGGGLDMKAFLLDLEKTYRAAALERP